MDSLDIAFTLTALLVAAFFVALVAIGVHIRRAEKRARANKPSE